MVSMMSLADTKRINESLFHTQRLAGIGTLTASVAHELTNPLSIITATCSNLIHEIKSGEPDTAALLHYIQMIEQSAWRSAHMVEVLRQYTHDNGLETAVTSLNMIIQDALSLVKPQFIKEYKTRITLDLAPDLRSIVCDHNRLVQVVINLLLNARDAMQPGGGNILVCAWSVPAGAYLPGETETAVPLPERLAFSVSDQGTGIPLQLLTQIFEPFFTTKPSGTGMGLGLFIAREIVAEHNGRIWAENNPDRGATLTVVLPQRP